MATFIKYTKHQNDAPVAINFDLVLFMEPHSNGGTTISLVGPYTITVKESFESIRQELWIAGQSPDE